MKLIILLNIAAIILAFGLRHYARSSQRTNADEQYQFLIRAGLLDEAKAETYAREHKGSHPRDWLRSIGRPDGFVQGLMAVILVVCGVNSLAILSFTRKKGTHVG